MVIPYQNKALKNFDLGTQSAIFGTPQGAPGP